MLLSYYKANTKSCAYVRLYGSGLFNFVLLLHLEPHVYTLLLNMASRKWTATTTLTKFPVKQRKELAHANCENVASEAKVV